MAIEISGHAPAQLSNAKSDAKVQQVGPTAPRLPEQQTGKPSAADTITLTDTASKIQQLESQISAVPIVDASRVEGVKRSILNGQFRVDPQRVAEKMMNFENARGRLS